MNVSVLGPPGCGKGTQAKLLAAHFGLKHFSLGETLRAEIEHGSNLGQRTAEIVREGKLVPDQLVEEIFESFVKKNPGKGFVLDGYPRTLEQAMALERILKFSAVLLFEVSEEEVLARVEGRVIDDQAVPTTFQNPPPESRGNEKTTSPNRALPRIYRDIRPIADLYARGTWCRSAV
jgi:adenylate kinase